MVLPSRHLSRLAGVSSKSGVGGRITLAVVADIATACEHAWSHAHIAGLADPGGNGNLQTGRWLLFV